MELQTIPFELNRLYNLDCKQAMKQIPDKYFELAIVDPPYGIGENGTKNHTRSKLAKSKDYKSYAGNDSAPPDEEYFRELFRISQNQVIFGANHFISKIPYDSSCWIVWDKENGNNDFADCELAWTSFKSAVRIFRFRWSGMLQGDMKNKEIRIHPNQKPVPLYQWIIGRWAKPGDKIIDTHAGFGSCLVAAYRASHKFLGFELDKDYFTAADKRLRDEMAQMTIFDFMGG
ncbi:MAG: site-specific DNA-methyltransferase [Ruminococcus flavefaciens]|nr:site-specific DNA-methyltransferase [Ruminococcus flavefaciens]